MELVVALIQLVIAVVWFAFLIGVLWVWGYVAVMCVRWLVRQLSSPSSQSSIERTRATMNQTSQEAQRQMEQASAAYRRQVTQYLEDINRRSR